MLPPLGDHAGEPSGPRQAHVRYRSFVLSALMTLIALPSAYAMRVPSGDHAGETPQPLVRRVIAPVPRSTMNRCQPSPSRVLENTSLVPSGDHDGSASEVFVSPVVTFCASLPSAFITQTSMRPSRSLMNAILSPCAENAGDWSTAGLRVRFVWAAPSIRAV